ncbi:11615_t:CDS:1 [Rhizophagus irregularis]|nr:11615_t:CDS:1 [Rhizophagus irregularis]
MQDISLTKELPLEDVVDNAYYFKHRERLHEKNILFLDQIISGDKSHLLLWKEILIKAFFTTKKKPNGIQILEI